MAARYCRVCASASERRFYPTKGLGAFGDGGCILGDELAGGALRVDQSRAFKICKGALHGIRIDTGVGRKVTHRWELAAGRIDAGDNLLLKARNELRVDGLIGLKLPGHEVTSCATVLSD